ncbi:MAG: hypothetical protein ACFUZC_07235 [Chthoniobacteraceae bacterium]
MFWDNDEDIGNERGDMDVERDSDYVQLDPNGEEDPDYFDDPDEEDDSF